MSTTIGKKTNLIVLTEVTAGQFGTIVVTTIILLKTQHVIVTALTAHGEYGNI
jgi:hypothetical protein